MNPRAAGQKLTQRQKPLLFQSLQAPSLSLVPAHPRLFHLLQCQAEPQRLGSLQPQKPPLPRGVSPRRTRPCKATRSSLLTGREAEALSDHPASSRAESPHVARFSPPKTPVVRETHGLGGLGGRPPPQAQPVQRLQLLMQLGSNAAPCLASPRLPTPSPVPLAPEAGTRGLQTQCEPGLNSHTQPTRQRKGDPGQEVPAGR